MIKHLIPYIAGFALMVSASTEAMAAQCVSLEIYGDMRVQQLDIFLMVNSLRCRATSDDFRPEYDGFTANHHADMSRRISAVLTALGRNATPAAARAELEQARTVMANHAAQPTALSCADLKQLTAQLTTAPEDKVAYAADVLVNGSLAVEVCPVQVAVAAAPALRK